jgi:GTP-binding protein
MDDGRWTTDDGRQTIMTTSPLTTFFAGDCTFKVGAVKMEDIPAGMTLPEVAFVGRSNVGKSSLLNAVTGRNSLARTSSNPGHTRQLNFFSLRDKLMLVDLPGYGYARASKQEIAGWTGLIRRYLAGRPNLMRVFLLIDARHGVKSSDNDIMCLLDDAAICYQVVLTKVDKASAKEVAEIIASIEHSMPKHAAMYPEVLATSAKDKQGILAVQEAMASFVSL